MQQRKPSAIFSVSSLGLGHATRTLPVLRSYLPSHHIHVVSAGNALAFLRKELADADVVFHEFQDYPPLERGRGVAFHWFLVKDSLATVGIIRKEHAFIERLARKIGPAFIFSDGRYGSYVRGVPSFILSHQISFVLPRGFGIFQGIADRFNYRTFARFDMLFIPDFEHADHSLAGDLARHPMLRKLEHRFVGPLSSMERRDRDRDIDFLFTLSGYIVEHKASFLANLVEQAKRLPGKKVFVLGEPSNESITRIEESDIEIRGSVAGDERIELFNRARYVVSRSGYTTIMDLVELDAVGFLVPTPGQTEQEYLAEYLAFRSQFLTSLSQDIDLVGAHAKLASKSVGKVPWKTARSVEIVRGIIESHARPIFFSIVIPAHNEAKYIERTLRCVEALEYPQDSFEALVIENGSTDRTLAIARAHEKENLCVLVSPKGASRAKNFGIMNVSPRSEWIVLLDADTYVGKAFLRELDAFLRANRRKGFSVGTSTVLPDGKKRLKADLWFAFYNAGHALTKTSFAIQIMKASHRDVIRFDETKTYAEDLKLIKDLLRLGSFFYFKTKQVVTSTRRFDEVGWTRLFFRWNWQALVLSRKKKETSEYDVIR